MFNFFPSPDILYFVNMDAAGMLYKRSSNSVLTNRVGSSICISL